MYAMQYELTFPADYDMAIIHTRVADRGFRTDDFPGLGLKSYLYREKGIDGSPVNQYAPFYLWHDAAGLNRFLLGGGWFSGIVADFGRPEVRHWSGIAAAAGPAREFAPRSASRETELLPADVDPSVVVEAELAALRKHAATEGVHTTAFAIDPQRWEVVRFTLWHDESAPVDGGERYKVGHLSAPGLDAITREWL